jgi:LuxR family transcriptional regulator, maltose regulon positive regulatory protein
MYSDAALAILAMDDGRWVEAHEHVSVALAAVQEYRMHDFGVSGLAYAAAARDAAHCGLADEAKRFVALVMRVRGTLTVAHPFLAVRVRLQLGKACCAIGDSTTARHLLREIDAVLVHRPRLGALLDQVEALRHTVTSSDTVRIGASPLTAAEMRLLPYLQTHLTIREIADRLYVSRNTVNSQVSAIYRKMGVSSRTQAVQRATALGLLGG